MLLWVAIDRFSSLKYNKDKIYLNNRRFSNEQVFIETLENLDIEERDIYTTDNLKKFHLSGDIESNWAINYYSFGQKIF